MVEKDAPTQDAHQHRSGSHRPLDRGLGHNKVQACFFDQIGQHTAKSVIGAIDCRKMPFAEQ